MGLFLKKLLSKLYDYEEINNKDLEKTKELVSKIYNIPKSLLDKVKVRFSTLPTIYVYSIRRVGNYLEVIYKPIAKILGFYNPAKKEIYIEKRLSPYQKFKTLIHEYIHAAQDYLGKLYTKSKEELEEEAYRLSDKLSKIYNQVSQKYPSF